MTLDEFRATRRECADIGGALNDEACDGVAGYIYADMLWIERTRDGVEYHETQPSGAPEAMEFYHVDADHRRLILGPDSIAKLRAIMAYV